MDREVTIEGKQARADALREEQGMAWRLFCDMTGMDPRMPVTDDASDEELLEEAWAERGAFD